MNYTNTIKNYNTIPTIFWLFYLLFFISIISLFYCSLIKKTIYYFFNKPSNKVGYYEDLRYHNPDYAYLEVFLDKLNTKCIICLEEFNKGDCIYKTDCCHYFHKDCILRHFDNSYNCPICRKFVYDTYDVNII